MNAIGAIERKIAPVLPRGNEPLKRFVKDALFLQLQDVNKKIALFEGKYNHGFQEFERMWKKAARVKKHAYETEGDYMDWEALEDHKRMIMGVIHSFDD
ncbi:MAG: hypothetical protein AAB533_04230 [Patescibacteria group bacterium]